MSGLVPRPSAAGGERLLRGIGTRLVALAREGALGAGCRWLHADYDEQLVPFYEDNCGFDPTRAGLMALS